jgi:hypothetical protein
MFRRPQPKVPRALIRIDERRIVEGFVTTLTSRELVARYVSAPPVALPLGSRITISLHREDQRSVHEARVVGRAEFGGDVEYRFEAAGEDSFTASSERNQRIALRVELGSIWPLEAQLWPNGCEDTSGPVFATVVDLSRHGFGAEVPLEAEDLLAQHEIVRVRLQLSVDEEPLLPVCKIRQRRIHGTSLRYGIQFHEALTADFEQLVRAVEGFVRRRLIDLARSQIRRPAG